MPSQSPGGADWRAEIRAGIDKCDVVLLMLTPDACNSPQVKEEVDYAKSIGRRVIPLQIKTCSQDDLTRLGVEHLNFINFVSSERDAWDKLLSKDTLPPVLDRDRRRLDPAFNRLHTDYLRSLFARLSRVNLTYLLDAAPKEKIKLMDVYVPLFLGVRIYGKIEEAGFTWWSELAKTGDSEKRFVKKQIPGISIQPQMLEIFSERLRLALGGQEDSSRWRFESEEAAALAPYLVLLGDPGSGKSTLIQHLALCMAGDMLSESEESEADLNRLRFWPLPAYTPVFIELRALVRTAFSNPKESVTLEKLYGYLESELKKDGLTAYLEDLRGQMRDGDAMFFLDGLDEVPDADKTDRREQIKALAHLLRESFPKCRILITSRPYAYAGDWQLEGFGQVKLAALDPDRLEELALRLFRVVLGQEGAEENAGQFKTALKGVPEELRSSPLFFTLMAAIWLNNSTKPAAQRLPVRKGDIYRECVEMLIKRWTRKDLGGDSVADRIGLDEKQLRTVLELLAYSVHSEAGDKDDAVFDGGKIFNAVRELRIKGVDYESLIESLAQRAGVIFEKAPNVFQFAHRSFQEHLSACYLTHADHFPVYAANNLHTNFAAWRNVSELLPAEAARQKADLWKLVRELLPAKGAPLPTERDDPAWNCILYAGQLLTEHLSSEDERQDIYRPRLRDSLVQLVTIGALPPVDRAYAGRILSDIGDPRPGVGLLPNGLPDIVWCDVPAGTYRLGSDDQSDNPKYEVDLAAFKIAKYPITYRQYQAFLDDPDGYSNSHWWDALHEDGKTQQQKGAFEQRFKYWNHPRETVSWYDAVAFCFWLSSKLDYEVRLPTEDEWEAAARYRRARLCLPRRIRCDKGELR